VTMTQNSDKKYPLGSMQWWALLPLIILQYKMLCEGTSRSHARINQQSFSWSMVTTTAHLLHTVQHTIIVTPEESSSFHEDEDEDRIIDPRDPIKIHDKALEDPSNQQPLRANGRRKTNTTAACTNVCTTACTNACTNACATTNEFFILSLAVNVMVILALSSIVICYHTMKAAGDHEKLN